MPAGDYDNDGERILASQSSIARRSYKASGLFACSLVRKEWRGD